MYYKVFHSPLSTISLILNDVEHYAELLFASQLHFDPDLVLNNDLMYISMKSLKPNSIQIIFIDPKYCDKKRVSLEQATFVKYGLRDNCK